jgi:hypothetical protein
MSYVNPLRLDVDAIYELSNYANWIPITQGYYKELFDLKYPGWEWNQLIPELLDAGVLVFKPEGDSYRPLLQGLWIADAVEAVVVSALDEEMVKVRVIKRKVVGK